MTTEDRSSHNGGRARLGLTFTIDYLLFNKGVKGSKEEPAGCWTEMQTACNMQNHQNPKPKEVRILPEIEGTQSGAEGKDKKVKAEERYEEQREEGEEEVTITNSTGISSETSLDKPNQSYIALISKAILASEEKKLLLCDIYQWIMDHYPYFKSKDKNWRNSVRHNLSLNDCFIKAGRSDNGKGHFWAVHPANFHDFSNGDYHCRRARRRARRVIGQHHLTQSAPYYPVLAYPHRTSCWCCPAPAHPLTCLATRLYWPWPSVQARDGVHLGLHGPSP
ncbi:forkhead box Q2 [Thalassophryne amazonica]|uniref:forkhead box Q2 n=1 Tax=Thalassophryne amazonica TaxID=390379 RepID=UPI0014718384|nr:forkhead box Q2 [Thalassophryne amazonica]